MFVEFSTFFRWQDSYYQYFEQNQIDITITKNN